jgi:hypothetical protein
MVTLAYPPAEGGRSSPPASVEVRYGTHRLVARLDGWTVGMVKSELRDRWGLPYICDAVLNGQVVGVSVALRVGDRLEFRRFAFKAAEDNPYAEADLLITNTPELQRIAAEEDAGEAVRKAVQFCLARYGQPGRNDLASVFEVLARIAASVAGLAERLDALQNPERAAREIESPFMTLPEAAAYTRLEPGTLNNAIYRGELAKQKRHRKIILRRDELDRFMASEPPKRKRPRRSK